MNEERRRTISDTTHELLRKQSNTIQDNTLDTTIDEWRKEMEKLDKGDPGTTIMELAVKFNLCRATMQKRINKLIDEGRCIRGIGTRTDQGGRQQRVPVYQLKKAGNK